ncbi:MerR family transcriptional regulator [Cohnella thermotolerans]|jgi:DNA-binding transcriptional MerR regulator|uniref:MerR family transcriptional regulator n=1 Tax=Cohnella thermotolerans TaxID=329858 RepID=UPI0004014BFA|nr:MerR family transcriptional regulator [Cohnella thermotolerans]
MALYKIDDVAKQCGLTKRTIRYYEEIGLLPAPQRSEGGTRLYTDEHIATLNKLIRARDSLGFTLQELQRYLIVSDILEGKRQTYREMTESLTPEERKEKLLDMEEALDKQLDLIETKLSNIMTIKGELEELKTRIRKRLETL